MEQHGRLTLLRVEAQRSADNHIVGLWKCECGNEKAIMLSRVRNGYTMSCGCMAVELSKTRNKTHGQRQSREYSSWGAMKSRCLDPNNKDYPRWGAKGIAIHAEWIDSFESFLSHIGPRPAGTTLDRINSLKGYEPGNVRWATPQEQARNRHSTYQWQIRGFLFETCDEAAEFFKVSAHTVWRWVNGQFDKRRNTFTEPRKDCHVTARY